jgi:hypothetical protein
MSLVGSAPWPTATTAGATSILVLLVAVLPSTEAVLPFVGRIAELALAGGAAYLIDDAAASLTTVMPKGTWRRRWPMLAAGTVVLACGWTAVLLVLTWRDAGPRTFPATGELVVLGLAALAAAAVMVRNGDSEPGARVGPVLVLLGLGLVIVESAIHRPILVPWDDAPTIGLLSAWAGVGLLSLLVAVWALRDPAAGPALTR